jgi:hypothetical protein
MNLRREACLEFGNSTQDWRGHDSAVAAFPRLGKLISQQLAENGRCDYRPSGAV